jgi:8-oxo-dGTP pyrophosphatase MutT (NUDIX family)
MAAPVGSIENPIPRRAARVLLIDHAGRVLMFRGFDPANPGLRYWFTAGGGLDPGETPVDGALRELREETGLEISAEELGPSVWRDVTEFPFDGRWFRQEQEFFAVRVASLEVRIDGFDSDEQRSIVGFRWWTPDELDAADEPIHPPQLPDLLRSLGGA